MTRAPSRPEHPTREPQLDHGDEEPVLTRIVNQALAPYVGKVPPQRLEEYRNLLTLFITTHPAMAARYARVRSRPAIVAASTDLVRADVPLLDALRAAAGEAKRR